MAIIGLRFRGSSSSGLKNDGEEDKKASDKAKYSCGCLAAIKFVASTLGSVLYGRKAIEDESSEETSVANELGLSNEERKAALSLQLSHDLSSGDNDSEPPGSVGLFPAFDATFGAFGKEEVSSLKRYDRVNLSCFSRRDGSYDSKAAIDYLYNTRLSDGELILYRMPDNIVDGIKGIENMNNSCTIASLLFNMFGATSFFDELLLVGPETDKTDKDIRFHLIEIANDLRARDRRVAAEKLDNFRDLVMGKETKGRFLQPDEFLNALFEKLHIDRDNEITFLDMREKDTSPVEELIEEIVSNFSTVVRALNDVVNMQDFMEREDQIRNNYETTIASIDSLSNPEESEYFTTQYVKYLSLTEVLKDWKPECRNVNEFIMMVKEKCFILAKKKINSEENKVLFIQVPRQGYDAAKAYKEITPSLYISVERQRYKFQSVVVNEHDVHNASWVILPKDGVNESYYFNGGGVGTPRIEPKKEIYELLFGAKDIRDASSELQGSYKKLLQEGAFYIYIRE
ncbi:MAG: hypothetical protein KR126chlam4_00581 [Candidatus Anoxychlamydiales bacterium]|nr:hypothetical protein [Candidatus Anoxychlamydiales bacterium]HEU64945.1 hypothetical protein [Chlamydiota bacterium]